MAERLEERTPQYRFRYMAFGAVLREDHVSLVDASGDPYGDNYATYVALGKDIAPNRLASRVVRTPSGKVSLHRTAGQVRRISFGQLIWHSGTDRCRCRRGCRCLRCRGL